MTETEKGWQRLGLHPEHRETGRVWVGPLLLSGLKHCPTAHGRSLP